MRPLDKTIYTQHKNEYNPYGNAKRDLIKSIGDYCSYCEIQSPALDVEHIHNKHTHTHLEYKWDNFLLACKNCNPIKGVKEVNFSEIFMPHVDDTYSIFNYLQGGVILVNKKLSVTEQKKAQNLIDLVGLDRDPAHPKYSDKDERWSYRRKYDTLANKYLQSYKENTENIDTIVNLAVLSGFWSLWMNVFKEYPEVQIKLMENFSGTNLNFSYQKER